MPTVHLIIRGRVQGVFYRATAREMAEKIGITGWVKNTNEGHVEVLASGTDDQLEEFIAWCRVGPPKAIVQEVHRTVKPETFFDRFKVER